jgi:hypothetical protein
MEGVTGLFFVVPEGGFSPVSANYINSVVKNTSFSSFIINEAKKSLSQIISCQI